MIKIMKFVKVADKHHVQFNFQKEKKVIKNM